MARGTHLASSFLSSFIFFLSLTEWQEAAWHEYELIIVIIIIDKSLRRIYAVLGLVCIKGMECKLRIGELRVS